MRGEYKTMNIKTNAVAGTLESSDVYVKVEPSDKLEISIESVVYNQIGRASCRERV